MFDPAVPLLDPWGLFSLCPSCGRQGEFHAALSKGDHTTLTYRCGACLSVWDVAGTDADQWPDAGSRSHSPALPSTDAK
jgi:hypothetical protein